MTQDLASQPWRHAVAALVICAVTCMGASDAVAQEVSALESPDATAPAAAAAAEAPPEAQDQVNQIEFGRGMFVEVHGLFQGQILAGTDPTRDMTQSAFRLRRSEVAFTGTFGANVSVKVMFDLSKPVSFDSNILSVGSPRSTVGLGASRDPHGRPADGQRRWPDLPPGGPPGRHIDPFDHRRRELDGPCYCSAMA